MKTPVRRPTRVGELIREQISALMPELRDPRIGLTTVTEVKMSPDLNTDECTSAFSAAPKSAPRRWPA